MIQEDPEQLTDYADVHLRQPLQPECRQGSKPHETNQPEPFP